MATLALNRATAPNELNNDTISKLYLYVNTLKQGIRAEAFERTQQQMQKMATHRAQSPQIDVNGNAVSNEFWTYGPWANVVSQPISLVCHYHRPLPVN